MCLIVSPEPPQASEEVGQQRNRLKKHGLWIYDEAHGSKALKTAVSDGFTMRHMGPYDEAHGNRPPFTIRHMAPVGIGN